MSRLIEHFTDSPFCHVGFIWRMDDIDRIMLLESAGGDLIKRSLPVADANGEVMMVLDEKSPSDAGFLRLLTDPTSTGSFLL